MDGLLEDLTPEALAELDDRLSDAGSGQYSCGNQSWVFDELLMVVEHHREAFQPLFNAYGLDYYERIGLTGLSGLVEASLVGRQVEIKSLSNRRQDDDYDVCNLTLPLRYLLPDGLQRIARDARLLKKGLARIAAAKATRAARQQECRERARLVELLDKHGMPPGRDRSADEAPTVAAAKLQAMHRRAQRAEAAQQALQAKIDEYQAASVRLVNQWSFEFQRLCSAHDEIRQMFQALAEVYDYPEQGKALHSVMDLKGGSEKCEGVWANCFLSARHGGMQSYRVLDEVRRAVAEIKENRSAK